MPFCPAIRYIFFAEKAKKDTTSIGAGLDIYVFKRPFG
jgi:hypothetical protein